jgi:hypothetical protein
MYFRQVQVQQRLERHEVVNGQFAANMALNAMLLQQTRYPRAPHCPPRPGDG